MLRKAQEVISSGDVRAVVDFGIELDRTIKTGSQELEEIKRFLRKVGATSLADRRTEKTVQLEGHLGIVTVTYPADGPKLKSGVDLLASEQGIPEDVWKRLFVKRTTVDFADNFIEKLATLEEDDREMITNLIEVQGATPRVTWSR